MGFTCPIKGVANDVYKIFPAPLNGAVAVMKASCYLFCVALLEVVRHNDRIMLIVLDSFQCSFNLHDLKRVAGNLTFKILYELLPLLLYILLRCIASVYTEFDYVLGFT